MHIHACDIYVCIYKHMHHTHIHTHVYYICVCMYMGMRICMYMHICVYVCIVYVHVTLGAAYGGPFPATTAYNLVFLKYSGPLLSLGQFVESDIKFEFSTAMLPCARCGTLSQTDSEWHTATLCIRSICGPLSVTHFSCTCVS